MIEYKGEPVREFRCYKCRRLLGLEYIYAGRLTIKCPKCNTMNEINFKSTNSEMIELKKRGGDK